MASLPPHHPGPPRYFDDGNRGFPGPSSYEYHAPPAQLAPHHQYDQHNRRHHQQHVQSPPTSSTANCSAHANYSHSSYSSHSSQSIGRHYGPGNPGVSVTDLYQASPVGPPPPPPSSNSMPPLPSMRTTEPLPPPSIPNCMPYPPPYTAPQNLHGGPRPLYPIQPPYGMQNLPSFSNYSLHHGHMNELRVPQYSVNALRHKKDIKRRTKTGCMTCRKRRIKCDETHPTCNNCKKSKRDCAGYDPIFKPQLANAPLGQATAHSPPQIEPTSASSARSSSPHPSAPGIPTSFASVMASTRPSVGSITSPSVTSRPSYQLSAPSNSDGAASSYYCAAIPPVPSKNVPEYPSKTATISRRNGDSTQQQPSTNGHQDRHSSLDSHSGGGAHAAPRLEVDTGIYSSRPAVSLRENERPPYDATGHAHKNEPKRDYWADRPQPVYLNGNPEAQDFRRYI